MRRWWNLPEGWLSLLLLVLMVVTVASSLQRAGWAASLQAGLGILPWAALLGLVVGFILARIRAIPRAMSHLLGVIGGLAWVVQLSGSLRLVRVPGSFQPVSFLSPALRGWKDLATELLLRVLFLGRAFLRGNTGEDVVLFIILLALACWFLGFLSAWFTFRSHWPWVAMGLPAIVLLLTLVYGPAVPSRYFDAFAFLGLLFLFYVLWRQQESRWVKERVHYPNELSRGMFWVGFAFSAVIVITTAFLPATAASQESASFWDRFLQPWRETREAWDRLFSEVEGTGEGRLGEFAPTFDLGGARIRPQGIALEVHSGRNEYLRALSFDQYDGRGWTDTAERGPVWHLPAGQKMPPSLMKRALSAQVIVPREQGGNMVFAFAEPVSMTVSSIVELGTPDAEAGFNDIVAIRSRTGLMEGRAYGVLSLVSIADKDSLRSAGGNYPAWVRRRYLQLPDGLPQRVRGLGDQILVEWLQEHGVAAPAPGALVAAGLINPYDAAEAIQNYLRTHYSYRTDISAPPPGGDSVDYFLFESKAGYCDYFASAMVVLLRAEGIPARLVRGYAGGSYDGDKAAYIVPLAAAHSWVEAYFPNYGWQRFEPTAADYTSLPVRPEHAEEPTVRPRGTPGAAPTREPRDPFADEEDVEIPEGGVYKPSWVASALTRPALLIPSIAGLLLVGALVGFSIWGNRGLRGLTPAAASYERMCRWATWARLYPEGRPTPYETAWRIAEGLPQQRPAIARIATLYVRERFGRYRPPSEEETDVLQAWRELRWPLWGRLLQRLRRKPAVEVEEVEE